MDDLQTFEARCRDMSWQLRDLPKELRKALSVRVKPEVAVPLAARIGSAASGPWGPVLAKATKARAGADPTIVIGGARKVVSGGAAAWQLVYGTEFGANGRTVTQVYIKASRGTHTYQRHSTRQFVAHKHPFIFPTLRRSNDWVLDQFAGIVDDVLGSDG